jgi:hypothetical protein
MKQRKRKTMGAILQDADENIQGNIKGGYYWGEHIYRVLTNVWKTAFARGYDKALRDQSKPLKDAIKYVQHTKILYPPDKEKP